MEGQLSFHTQKDLTPFCAAVVSLIRLFSLTVTRAAGSLPAPHLCLAVALQDHGQALLRLTVPLILIKISST